MNALMGKFIFYNSFSLTRDFIICARTDARGVIGMDEAIKRTLKVNKQF